MRREPRIELRSGEEEEVRCESLSSLHHPPLPLSPGLRTGDPKSESVQQHNPPTPALAYVLPSPSRFDDEAKTPVPFPIFFVPWIIPSVVSDSLRDANRCAIFDDGFAFFLSSLAVLPCELSHTQNPTVQSHTSIPRLLQR